MEQKEKGLLASFFVGNRFTKATQVVLLLNVLISIFYCIYIIYDLISIAPDFGAEGLLIIVIPILIVIAFVNFALMQLVKSSQNDSLDKTIKVSMAVVIGYPCFLGLSAPIWGILSYIFVI